MKVFPLTGEKQTTLKKEKAIFLLQKAYFVESLAFCSKNHRQ